MTPSAREVDAELMEEGVLRDKFGAGLSPIWDAHLIHTTKFIIPGVKPVNYDQFMKLNRHHISQGWKISSAESKKHPYTPWARDPDSQYPVRQNHLGGQGRKHRRKHDPEDEVDLTGASDSGGLPEAKHQRRYSPRRPNKFPPASATLGTATTAHQ